MYHSPNHYQVWSALKKGNVAVIPHLRALTVNKYGTRFILFSRDSLLLSVELPLHLAKFAAAIAWHCHEVHERHLINHKLHFEPLGSPPPIVITIARLQTLLKFSVNLKGIKTCESGWKRFPKNEKGGQTASRGGEGRYISLQDKSAFHGAVRENTGAPSERRRCGFLPPSALRFSDLKINKRQVQQHSGRHETQSCGSWTQLN